MKHALMLSEYADKRARAEKICQSLRGYYIWAVKSFQNCTKYPLRKMDKPTYDKDRVEYIVYCKYISNY